MNRTSRSSRSTRTRSILAIVSSCLLLTLGLLVAAPVDSAPLPTALAEARTPTLAPSTERRLVGSVETPRVQPPAPESWLPAPGGEAEVAFAAFAGEIAAPEVDDAGGSAKASGGDKELKKLLKAYEAERDALYHALQKVGDHQAALAAAQQALLTAQSLPEDTPKAAKKKAKKIAAAEKALAKHQLQLAIWNTEVDEQEMQIEALLGHILEKDPDFVPPPYTSKQGKKLDKLASSYQATQGKLANAQDKVATFQELLDQAYAELAAAEQMPENTPAEIKRKQKAIKKASDKIAKYSGKLSKWSGMVTKHTGHLVKLAEDIESIDSGFFDPDPSGGAIPDVAASPGPGSVTFDWTDVQGAQGYTLYWSLGPNIDPGSANAVATAQSHHTVLGLGGGVTVYGMVTALVDGLPSPPSDEVFATTQAVSGPTIGLSTGTMSFGASAGGSNPPAKTLHIVNLGTGPFSWDLTSNAAWLGATPTSGTLAPTQVQQVSVFVQTQGVTAGSHNGTLLVTSPEASNGPQQVGVTLDLSSADKPVIALAPTEVSFSAVDDGAPPAPAYVALVNTGGTNLDWSATSSANWLAVDPPSGVLVPGATRILELVPNLAALDAGTHVAAVTIDGPDTHNGPQSVAVTFAVQAAAPSITLTPAAGLAFGAVEGGADPAAKTATIKNSGTGTLQWTATSQASWLSVSPVSGQNLTGAGKNLQVSVDASGLASGSYSSGIVFADAAAGVSKTLPVTLTVSAAPMPVIGLSPGMLSFSGTQGASDPAAQTLTVSNTGTAPLSWSASDGAGWLSVSPTSGTVSPGASSNLTVTAALGGLAAGGYATSISVSDPAASNDPESVPVTLTVSAPPAPTISLLPSQLAFGIEQGGNPPAKTLTLKNVGTAPLAFSASDDKSWIGVSPSGGNLAPGASTTLTVSISSSSLGTGSYTGTVTVSDPAATNNPKSIPISLAVGPQSKPTITLSPGSLSFSGSQGGPSPANQTVTLGNTGSAPLAFTASDSASWLSVTPASGTVAAGGSTTLTVATNTSGLAAGGYNAAVTVADPGASNSPQVLPVSLTVAGVTVPEIDLSPSSMAFSAVSGGAAPSSQSLQIKNTGGGTLSWSASDSAGWLSLGKTSGTLSAGASTTVSVSVNASGLSTGSHSAAITVSDSGASNSPQTVTVSLSVSSGSGAITASAAPSRTSGVAPLVVFFDASNTVAPNLTGNPFHDLHYSWDFADPGSGNWATTGLPRNRAIGPMAAHVFEQPGTYPVVLTVRDRSGAVDQETVTITVQDPDVVYSGSKTVCVSRTGNFSGAPAGAQLVTTTSFSTAMSHVGTGKRVLLRRGESWTASKKSINSPGPGTIGAFGSGAKPKISSSTGIFQFSGSNPNCRDWRVMDLELTGAGADALHCEGTTENLLLLRLNIHHVDRGLSAALNTLDFYGNMPLHDVIALVDTSISDCGNKMIMVACGRFVSLGSTFARADGHVMRLQWTHRGVIAHNAFSDSNAANHLLKMHAPGFNSAGIGKGKYTEKVVVANNLFDARASQWAVVPGPQNDSSDERLRDIILESNYFWAGSTSIILCRLSGENTTTRNNIFDGRNVSPKALHVAKRGIDPTPKNVRVCNNTFYSNDSGSFTAISLAGVQDADVYNNLGFAPNAGTKKLLEDGGTGTQASNNVFVGSSPFVSGSPDSPPEFKIGSGSSAAGGGQTQPGVVVDYAEQPRKSPPALGAYEAP